MRKQRFREDLYYRLKVVTLELPPLRERPEDIPALAQRFLERVTTRLGLEKRQLGDAALARLVRHRWPGNVRELANVIEQAAVLAPAAVIEEADLKLGGGARRRGGAAPSADAAGLSFADAKRSAVERFERALPARGAAPERREHLPRGRGDGHGPPEPAAEDPGARSSRRRLDPRRTTRRRTHEHAAITGTLGTALQPDPRRLRRLDPRRRASRIRAPSTSRRSRSGRGSTTS